MSAVQAKSHQSESRARRPRVVLKPKLERRLLYGHPWVYSNEVSLDNLARALEPGEIVTLAAADGRKLATAIYNRHTLIAARVVTREADATIDAAFFAGRLRHALALRERLYGQPYYRLIHAEADGIPGTIVDRYGSTLVLQINTAGIERLLPELLAALDEVLAPETVLLRDDSAARSLEGLQSGYRLVKGKLEGPVALLENGARFFADLGRGQKTGWFFDQRENRAWVARLAAGQRVLDCYCYAGGFAVQAALAGASDVVALDRSESALELARRAAEANGIEARVGFVKAEAFAALEERARAGERYGLVIADPPAFVKSKRDLNQGARGYRKLARLAASLVADGGFLFLASCSHHADAALFAEQVRRGLNDCGRSGRILLSAGAAADHPVHPALPESAYLKALLLALD